MAGMEFSKLIGLQITLYVQIQTDKVLPYAVKLLGVDSHGLWMESKDITNAVMTTAGRGGSEIPEVAIFLPFSKIFSATYSEP